MLLRLGKSQCNLHRSSFTTAVKQSTATTPRITCKIQKFNLSQGERNHVVNSKFGSIDLASRGWGHNKSKGDYFTIHPQPLLTHNSENTDQSASISTEVPSRTFDKLGLSKSIVTNLYRNLNVTHCTYIQYEGIPQILAGDHTIIAAETGCGKTLAYLIPIIEQMLQRKKERSAGGLVFNTPQALVLTPSRELATQIGEVAEKLCAGLGITVNVLLGGRTKQKMLNPHFDDVDLLIGTMGATSKLVTTGVYRMNRCQHVVLDEADTMLDDSFNEKLTHFLKRFPFHNNHLQNTNTDVNGAQLILAAATMPTNMAELLAPIVDPTTMLEIVSPKLHRLLSHVKQTFLRMTKTERPMQLLRLLKPELERCHPCIVFANKAATSDYISMFLNENGVNCVNLNGDMNAALRIGKFTQFQSGAVDVLSTTDIASRGLDTTRARIIVNFDFPLHMADYIHRVGRTGRLGSHSQCSATNFVSSQREIELVQRIEHTARTLDVLPNVNANITNIIKNRILQDINAQ